ncbi:MAG: hypothetical protein HQL52_03795 [Magnetococcales bacterium]|nr:hypothetical protein [Magnetococcales bacterium]
MATPRKKYAAVPLEQPPPLIAEAPQRRRLEGAAAVIDLIIYSDPTSLAPETEFHALRLARDLVVEHMEQAGQQAQGVPKS